MTSSAKRPKCRNDFTALTSQFYNNSIKISITFSEIATTLRLQQNSACLYPYGWFFRAEFKVYDNEVWFCFSNLKIRLVFPHEERVNTLSADLWSEKSTFKLFSQFLEAISRATAPTLGLFVLLNAFFLLNPNLEINFKFRN